jgi:hypothetical protein
MYMQKKVTYFLLWLFLIGSRVYAWIHMDCESPIYTSLIAGMICVPPCLAFIVKMGGGLSRTFCPSWGQTVILLISASQVAGITG